MIGTVLILLVLLGTYALVRRHKLSATARASFSADTDIAQYIASSVIEDVIEQVDSSPSIDKCVGFPHVFENVVSTFESECNDHHDQYNGPGWRCALCRNLEQNRLNLEFKIQEQEATLSMKECENAHFRHFIEQFTTEFQSVMDDLRTSKMTITNLELERSQLRNELGMLRSLNKENNELMTEKEEKLTTLRSLYDDTLEMNRFHRAEIERYEMQNEELRLDAIGMETRHSDLKRSLQQMKAVLENELIAKKNTLDWQLSDFALAEENVHISPFQTK